MINLELKAQIVRKFKTQREFADTMELDETLVSSVVRGRRQISQKQQKRWAKALGWNGDLEELFETDKELEKCYQMAG